MRNLLLLAALCFWGQMVWAQSSSVPSAVSDKMRAMFPKAENVKFEKEADGVYEANMRQGGQKLSAKFAENGDWLETETEITADKLPAKVADFLAKEYKGWKIQEVEKVSTPQMAVFYEIELKNRAARSEIQVDPNGVLIKKTEEKKGKD